MGVDTPKELKFIKSGMLNMVCIRNGKDVDKVACDTDQIINDIRITRPGGVMLDVVTFQPNCVFKVTLDFKHALPCIESSARESTDWVLCACMGGTAHYNRVEERLVLQQCVVSLQSNVDPLVTPFNLVLKFDEDCWEVERIYR